MARREPSTPPLSGGVENVPSNVSVFTVDTLSDLKSKKLSSVRDGDRAIITGYNTVDDGRSMEFRYDVYSSETADDINYVNPDSGSGQWVREWVDRFREYDTFADIDLLNEEWLIAHVKDDETNNNKETLYYWNGSKLNWIPTQEV